MKLVLSLYIIKEQPVRHINNLQNDPLAGLISLSLGSVARSGAHTLINLVTNPDLEVHVVELLMLFELFLNSNIGCCNLIPVLLVVLYFENAAAQKVSRLVYYLVDRVHFANIVNQLL